MQKIFLLILFVFTQFNIYAQDTTIEAEEDHVVFSDALKESKFLTDNVDEILKQAFKMIEYDNFNLFVALINPPPTSKQITLTNKQLSRSVVTTYQHDGVNISVEQPLLSVAIAKKLFPNIQVLLDRNVSIPKKIGPNDQSLLEYIGSNYTNSEREKLLLLLVTHPDFITEVIEQNDLTPLLNLHNFKLTQLVINEASDLIKIFEIVINSGTYNQQNIPNIVKKILGKIKLDLDDDDFSILWDLIFTQEDSAKEEMFKELLSNEQSSKKMIINGLKKLSRQDALAYMKLAIELGKFSIDDLIASEANEDNDNSYLCYAVVNMEDEIALPK